MSYGPAPRDTSWFNRTRESADPMADTRNWNRNGHGPQTKGKMPCSNFNSADFQRPTFHRDSEKDGHGDGQDGPNTFTTFLFDTLKRSASFAYRTLSFGGKENSTIGQEHGTQRESPKTPQMMRSPFVHQQQQPVIATYAPNENGAAPGMPHPSFNFGVGQFHPPSPGIPAPVFTQGAGGTTGPSHQLRAESSLMSTPSNQPCPPSSRVPASPQMESVLRALENTRIFSLEEAEILKRRIDHMTRGNTPVDVEVENSEVQRSHSGMGSHVHPGGHNRRINFSSAVSDRSSRSPSPNHRRRMRGRSAHGSGASGFGGGYSRQHRRRKRPYYDSEFYDEREHHHHSRPPSSSSHNFRHHPNKRRRLSRQEQLTDERLDEMIFGRQRDGDRRRQQGSRKRSRSPTRRQSSGEQASGGSGEQASPSSSHSSPAAKIPRSSLAHSSPRHLMSKRKKKKNGEDDDVEMNGRARSSEPSFPARSRPSVEEGSATESKSPPEKHGFGFPVRHSVGVGGTQQAPIFAEEADFPATRNLSRQSTVVSNNAGSKENSMDADVVIGNDGGDESLEHKEEKTTKTTVTTTTSTTTTSGDFRFSTGAPSTNFSFGGAGDLEQKKRGDRDDLSTIAEDGEDDEMMVKEDAQAKKSTAVPSKPAELPYYAKVMKQRKAKQRSEYVRRLNRIWKEFKPEKSGKAEQFLKKYLNERLHDVYVKACEKYELEPHSEYQGNDSDYCPTTAEKPVKGDNEEVHVEPGNNDYDPENEKWVRPKFKLFDPTPRKLTKKDDPDATEKESMIDKKDREEDDDKAPKQFKFQMGGKVDSSSTPSTGKPFSLNKSTVETVTTNKTEDENGTLPKPTMLVGRSFSTANKTDAGGSSFGGFDGVPTSFQFPKVASTETGSAKKEDGGGGASSLSNPSLSFGTNRASFGTDPQKGGFLFGSKKNEESKESVASVGKTTDTNEKKKENGENGFSLTASKTSTSFSSIQTTTTTNPPPTDPSKSFANFGESSTKKHGSSGVSFSFGKTNQAKGFAFATPKPKVDGEEEKKSDLTRASSFGTSTFATTTTPSKFSFQSGGEFGTPKPAATTTTNVFGTGGFGLKKNDNVEKKENSFGFGANSTKTTNGAPNANGGMFGGGNGMTTPSFNQSPFPKPPSFGTPATTNGTPATTFGNTTPSAFQLSGNFGNGAGFPQPSFGTNQNGNNTGGTGPGFSSNTFGSGTGGFAAPNNGTGGNGFGGGQQTFGTGAGGGGGAGGGQGSGFQMGGGGQQIQAANIFGNGKKRPVVRAKRRTQR